nr:MAG TPA: hypothetical protein [Caudoviricetes sp.]
MTRETLYSDKSKTRITRASFQHEFLRFPLQP